MKKLRTILAVIISLALLLQVGCAKDKDGYIDWNEIIRKDLLSEETEIEKAIAEAVKIEVVQSGEQLHLTIQAPDICDALLAWMENVPDEDFSDKALETEIIRLLSHTEITKTSHVLSFRENGDTVEIIYTQQIGEIVSCGLTRFYSELAQRVMEELWGM